MGRVTAKNLAEWASDAGERWSVLGIAVGVLQDGETVPGARNT
jgi:hypothetical protein